MVQVLCVKGMKVQVVAENRGENCHRNRRVEDSRS